MSRTAESRQFAQMILPVLQRAGEEMVQAVPNLRSVVEDTQSSVYAFSALLSFVAKNSPDVDQLVVSVSLRRSDHLAWTVDVVDRESMPIAELQVPRSTHVRMTQDPHFAAATVSDFLGSVRPAILASLKG